MAVRQAGKLDGTTWRVAAGAVGLLGGVAVTEAAAMLAGPPSAQAQKASAFVGANGTPGSTRSDSSVRYRNCDDARAAGATPVRQGTSGYGGHLDHDGDGVGCE